jgi:four helix bundle protein
MNEQPVLGHEKLDVYQCSIEFLALANEVLEHLPNGYAFVSDQLRRAALSIPLNIAEGAGKMTGPDRKRYFTIARGSAMECGAILDSLKVMKKVDEPAFRQGKHLLVRVVSMLTKM